MRDIMPCPTCDDGVMVLLGSVTSLEFEVVEVWQCEDCTYIRISIPAGDKSND